MASKKTKGKSDKKTPKSTKEEDLKAKEIAAEKEAKLKEAEKLAAEKEAKDKADAEAKLAAEEKSKKKNPEDLKPFSELTTIAYRQLWEKKELIKFVENTYKGFDVQVEEMNPRQIRFIIDGINVPKDGFYSVK